MQDFRNVHDEQTLIPEWRVSTLKIFIQAFDRYLHKLLPHNTPNNQKITSEVKTLKLLIQHIRDQIKKGDGDFDTVELPMRGTNYKLLSDVLHKYHAIKRSELEDKKKVALVEGALEGEEAEVEKIREILQLPLFQQIERRRTLVPDLSLQEKTKDMAQVTEAKIQQQITIGNLYGQAVFGDNFGQLQQNNNQELLATLQELFKIVSETKELPTEVKGTAIANIQTLQAQALSPKPDKTIVDKARASLSSLADASQVAQFGITIAPHLHKISELLSNLSF